eukprot:7385523-Prymnesium_polylepis.3
MPCQGSGTPIVLRAEMQARQWRVARAKLALPSLQGEAPAVSGLQASYPTRCERIVQRALRMPSLAPCNLAISSSRRHNA